MGIYGDQLLPCFQDKVMARKAGANDAGQRRSGCGGSSSATSFLLADQLIWRTVTRTVRFRPFPTHP